MRRSESESEGAGRPRRNGGFYRVHPRPHLNKSSHSDAALRNITFSLYSGRPTLRKTLFHFVSERVWAGFFFTPPPPSPYRAPPTASLIPFAVHSSFSQPHPPPFLFSQASTMEAFMWPHFETLRWGTGEAGLGAGGGRGDMHRGGGGCVCVWRQWGGLSFMRAQTSFSQPEHRRSATPEPS